MFLLDYLFIDEQILHVLGLILLELPLHTNVDKLVLALSAVKWDCVDVDFRFRH